MKKLLTIAVMLFFVIGLNACQENDKTNKQPNSTPNSHQQHPGTPSGPNAKGKDQTGSY